MPKYCCPQPVCRREWDGGKKGEGGGSGQVGCGLGGGGAVECHHGHPGGGKDGSGGQCHEDKDGDGLPLSGVARSQGQQTSLGE